MFETAGSDGPLVLRLIELVAEVTGSVEVEVRGSVAQVVEKCEGVPEDDVIAEGLVQDPRRLGDVREIAFQRDRTTPLLQLAQERGQQRRLTRAYLAHHGHKLAFADREVYIFQYQ